MSVYPVPAQITFKSWIFSSSALRKRLLLRLPDQLPSSASSSPTTATPKPQRVVLAAPVTDRFRLERAPTNPREARQVRVFKASGDEETPGEYAYDQVMRLRRPPLVGFECTLYPGSTLSFRVTFVPPLASSGRDFRDVLVLHSAFGKQEVPLLALGEHQELEDGAVPLPKVLLTAASPPPGVVGAVEKAAGKVEEVEVEEEEVVEVKRPRARAPRVKPPKVKPPKARPSKPQLEPMDSYLARAVRGKEQKRRKPRTRQAVMSEHEFDSELRALMDEEHEEQAVLDLPVELPVPVQRELQPPINARRRRSPRPSRSRITAVVEDEELEFYERLMARDRKRQNGVQFDVPGGPEDVQQEDDVQQDVAEDSLEEQVDDDDDELFEINGQCRALGRRFFSTKHAASGAVATSWLETQPLDVALSSLRDLKEWHTLENYNAFFARAAKTSPGSWHDCLQLLATMRNPSNHAVTPDADTYARMCSVGHVFVDELMESEKRELGALASLVKASGVPLRETHPKAAALDAAFPGDLGSVLDQAVVDEVALPLPAAYTVLDALGTWEQVHERRVALAGVDDGEQRRLVRAFEGRQRELEARLVNAARLRPMLKEGSNAARELLTRVFAQCRDYAAVDSMFARFEEERYVPSPQAVHWMLRALHEQERFADFEGVAAIFEHTPLEAQTVSLIMRCRVDSGKLDSLDEAKALWAQTSTKPSVAAYNVALEGILRNSAEGQPTAVLDAYEHMTTADGMVADLDTYKLVMRALAESGDVEGTVQVYLQLVPGRGTVSVTVDWEATELVLSWLLAAGERAKELLETVLRVAVVDCKHVLRSTTLEKCLRVVNDDVRSALTSAKVV